MNNLFTKTYTVQKHDIDELNHVSNIKYVEWIQEIRKKPIPPKHKKTLS